jgi:hypothetical protein
VLRKLVPLYSSIPRVFVGDGRRISFWHHAWLPDGALAVSRRALFTHTTKPDATMAQSCRSASATFWSLAYPRSEVRELELLRPILAAASMRDGPDASTL